MGQRPRDNRPGSRTKNPEVPSRDPDTRTCLEVTMGWTGPGQAGVGASEFFQIQHVTNLCAACRLFLGLIWLLQDPPPPAPRCCFLSLRFPIRGTSC